MNKLVFILSFLITYQYSIGQSDSASKFDISIKLGPTISNAKKANSYYDLYGNSYYGYNIRYTLGRRISTSLKLSTGIDFNTFKFYSGPFYKNRPYHSGTQYFLNPDNYESVTFYQEKFISIPITLEYSRSKRRFKPIVGIGLMFSSRFYQNSKDIRRSDLLDSSFFYSLDNYSEPSLNPLKIPINGIYMFATGNVGLSTSFHNLDLLLSLDYTHSLFNSLTNRSSLGINLGLNKHISSKKYPHKVKIDTSKQSKRNFLYVEIFGYGKYYSVNYERVFASFKNLALNSRVGVTLFPLPYTEDENYSKYFLPHAVPIGINAEFGEKRTFLIGLGYTFVVGDYIEIKKPFFISLGSTFVSKRNNFFRFLITPRMEGFWIQTIEPHLGISFGRNF